MEIKTIPLVKGDGVGPEVTASMVAIIDAAVEKAYGAQRRIVWKEKSANCDTST